MRRVLRDAALAALFAAFFILQMVLGDKLTLWGVKPELLPFAAAAAGVLAGKTTGAWLGFFGGVLCDITSPWGLGPRAAVFFLAGAVAGEITRHLLRRSPLVAFPIGLAAAALTQLADAVVHTALGVPWHDMILSAGYGTLYAVILSPISWILIWCIVKLFRAPEEAPAVLDPMRIDELHEARKGRGGAA